MHTGFALKKSTYPDTKGDKSAQSGGPQTAKKTFIQRQWWLFPPFAAQWGERLRVCVAAAERDPQPSVVVVVRRLCRVAHFTAALPRATIPPSSETESRSPWSAGRLQLPVRPRPPFASSFRGSSPTLRRRRHRRSDSQSPPLPYGSRRENGRSGVAAILFLFFFFSQCRRRRRGNATPEKKNDPD